MTEENAVRRGSRWLGFYNEEGGLRDMLGAIRASHFQAMSEAEPWEVAKLANLAIAAKQVESLNAMILTIINEGKVAEAAQKHTDQIASLPDFKRRWAERA